MTELSSAAQAVVNAALKDAYGQATPMLCYRIANALRAAADQFFTDWDATRCCVFLDAIADELENV